MYFAAIFSHKEIFKFAGEALFLNTGNHNFKKQHKSINVMHSAMLLSIKHIIDFKKTHSFILTNLKFNVKDLH